MSISTGQLGTNLGPLTTSWEAPSHCSIPVIRDLAIELGWQGQRCSTYDDDEGIRTTNILDDVDCWPPYDAVSPELPLRGWGFYSPGLVCPSDYVTACTAAYDERPEWPVQFSLDQNEMAVGCCPEGFGCTNRDGNVCILKISTSTRVTAGVCVDESIVTTEYDFPNTDVVTLSSGSEESTRGSEETVTLYAPLFQLVYRESDLTTETTTTEVSETAASSSSEDDSGASGLSGQEKLRIGVGVGVGVGVPALVALLVWVLVKYRRLRQTRPASPKADHGDAGMGETAKPLEMSGDARPAELSVERWDQ